MADLIVRCPVCLTQTTLNKTAAVTHEIKCAGCGRTYELRNALPAKDRLSTQQSVATVYSYPVKEPPGMASWGMGLIFASIAIVVARQQFQGMDGPSFLGFYLVVFLVGRFIGSSILD